MWVLRTPHVGFFEITFEEVGLLPYSLWLFLKFILLEDHVNEIAKDVAVAIETALV